MTDQDPGQGLPIRPTPRAGADIAEVEGSHVIMISTPKTHLRHTDTKPGAQDQAPAIATAGNRGPVS